MEEALFDRRRDLFSEVDLVFFDTTSLYFQGEGGSIGQRGHSKDHRPDLKQMVVGVAMDVEGRPICCEMWAGNTDRGDYLGARSRTDATALRRAGDSAWWLIAG